ncbi:MAG: retropepsin-like aspartic protease [Bacteroidota bacterium]
MRSNFTTLLVAISLCISVSFTDADYHSISTNYTSGMDLIGGFVLVQAKINGVDGNYIIDTGAPGLVLNSRYFKGAKSSDLQARGLSKELKVELCQVRRFEWLHLKKRHVQALVIDLQNLEERTDRMISGLIGYDLLKQCELFIDYENQIIQLFPSRKSPLNRLYENRFETRLDLSDHLPVVKVKVNGRRFHLGIDSGAESNIFRLQRSRKFKGQDVEAIGEHEVRGLDSEVQRVPVVRFSSASIQKESFDDLDFLLVDIDPFSSNESRPVDGLLGYPFLKSGKVSIDYPRARLRFWK